MKVLYIGHYEEGSTSKMRGQYLQKMLQPTILKVANIDVPMNATNKVFRTIGWRYKKGPLISHINSYIIKIIDNDWKYDLVWIDKGVFINPSTIKRLKENSYKLIHFTPDPAFFYHQSPLFYQSLSLYDYCITTKSFELDNYKSYGVKTILSTQGYEPTIHKPYTDFSAKKGVVFIGHYEQEREEVIAKLIEKKVLVTLAGIKWNGFVQKHKNDNNLQYLGTSILSHEYGKTLSNAKIGLGLLSKWIPELHTTRTFEIPACATALVTEKNKDTESIFTDTEVIFFNNTNHLVNEVVNYLTDDVLLAEKTKRGYQKVTQGLYSYEQIMANILQQTKIGSHDR